MELSDFLDCLDFDEFDYFYHETSRGNGERIMEEGLLVDGTNILGTNNILYTTASPLTSDMVDSFEEFIDTEKSNGEASRDVSEMVILGATKDYSKRLVRKFDDYVDGTYYEGIVDSSFVLGYVDLVTKKFSLNENYEYADEFFQDEDIHK